MALYRKRPIAIEAHRWDGDLQALTRWLASLPESPIGAIRDVTIPDIGNDEPQGIVIPALGGDHLCRLGDWLTCGVAGELYPCAEAIFRDTYEPVEG